MMLDSDKDETGGRRRPRLAGVLLALGAAWAAVCVVVVDVHLPSNAIDLPGEEVLDIPVRSAAPQGWAFFTRPAREERMTVWGESGGQWASLMTAPHGEPHNGFGFNRASRAQGVEMGMLSGQVDQDAWQDCDTGDVADCLASLDTDPIEVDNPGPSPTFCGQTALVLQEAAPWAWKRDAPETVIPARAIKLEASC